MAGIFSVLLGGGRSNDPADPVTQELLARVRQQMPDVADAPIAPMGALGRLMSGGALAVTSPSGSISYDPQTMQGSSPAEIGDTLVHELTHVRQTRNMGTLDKLLAVLKGAQQGFGGGLPYGQRPEELEAYQAEAEHANREGRTPAPAPTFTKPGFRSLGDIRLYP